MNPYSNKPSKAFWRSAVSDISMLEVQDLFTPRFEISKSMRISAAGSCFAQYIGQQFKERGYNFMDFEPPPLGLPQKMWHNHGFDLYSARYSNIYSIRQLVQTFARADGSFVPDEVAFIDEKGRARDPFRPAIEPNGFINEEELTLDREYHLQQINTMLDNTDLFVFTFGLTEAWECIKDGAILPSCPGTIAGTYDPDKYRFKNFTFSEVTNDAEAFMDYALKRNPDMKFLFTISPVPLTATATDDHVMVATMHSKSVLRAAIGELHKAYDNIDYFPSYELVAAHPMRAMYYKPNLRNVAMTGVERVMDLFFDAHGDTAPEPAEQSKPEQVSTHANEDDAVCEEAILETFGS